MSANDRSHRLRRMTGRDPLHPRLLAGTLDLLQGRFLAGIVAGLVAWRTRNIALTLAVGLGLVMLIDAL